MRITLLIALLFLAGCDQLTGAADQKIADAEAIGFACRVSQKTPEACMKENEAQSPSAILDGWKAADEDIKAGKLDPTMRNVAAPSGEDATAGSEDKPAEPAEEEKKAEPAEDAKKEESAKENKAARLQGEAAKEDAKAKH